MQQIKREGSIKGEGGLYKELKIPTLPPKSPRNGVTLHFMKIIFFSSMQLHERSECVRLVTIS